MPSLKWSVLKSVSLLKNLKSCESTYFQIIKVAISHLVTSLQNTTDLQLTSK